MIGTFCGSVVPPPVRLTLSKSTSLDLYFESDASFNGKGFNASYFLSESKGKCQADTQHQMQNRKLWLSLRIKPQMYVNRSTLYDKISILFSLNWRKENSTAASGSSPIKIHRYSNILLKKKRNLHL